MRAIVGLLIFFTLALVAAAALAYPAWLLVGIFSDQPIHRVMHRIAMLIALLGLFWFFRRWKVANKASLGFQLPRHEFTRQVVVGVAVGFAIMLPLMLTLFALDVRVMRLSFTWGPDEIAIVFLRSLVSGLVVAFIEETFFRGALFTAVRRESGTVTAIVLPSLLYASVHFLSGRLQLPRDQIEWSSGFAVLGKLLEHYAEPADLAGSFMTLFAVGVFLSLVRERTNAIAACIGLHAAWVCAIAIVRRISLVHDEAAAGWLVGSYDGVIGWGAMAWIAIMALAYVGFARRESSLSAQLGSSS